MHETITELLRRQPFEPFTITLSSGESFMVRHPDMAILLKSKLIIGLLENDTLVACALLHVTNSKTQKAA